MGFLHEGHLSLVRESKKNCDLTITSIFVNPTQFGPSEDFNNYPRDLKRDSELLQAEGVDYLFLPSTDDIYPQNFQTYVNVEDITKKFEGDIRPTHFRGVTTVVLILFNSIKPEFAYFGQKDAQQLAVIKQMVKDLKLNIQIIGCPIVRESDGLAMSSRNTYLSEAERNDALVLYRSLDLAKQMISSGEKKINLIISEMLELFSAIRSANLDYIRFVDADSFEIIGDLECGKEYYILVACRIGNTRLLDNLRFRF
jgi:pantoate--beta-alanine ligase